MSVVVSGALVAERRGPSGEPAELADERVRGDAVRQEPLAQGAGGRLLARAEAAVAAPAEARAESPALLPRRPGPGVHVWVGGDERPAFLDQARRLGNAWACPVTVEAGRHHFDVIDGLEQPDSPLMAALLG